MHARHQPVRIYGQTYTKPPQNLHKPHRKFLLHGVSGHFTRGYFFSAVPSKSGVKTTGDRCVYLRCIGVMFTLDCDQCRGGYSLCTSGQSQIRLKCRLEVGHSELS